MASSIASVTSTTGPLNTVAAGIRSDQVDPGGYTAARSQRMPDRRQQSCTGWGARASFFICVASRWLDPGTAALVRRTAAGERSWLARPSPSGAWVARRQTRGLPDSRVAAEAIRLRRPPADRSLKSVTTGQSASSRLRCRLKSARSPSSAAASTVTRGGWPAGASPGANRYHADGRRNQNDEPRNTERPSCVLHTLWQPVRQQPGDHLWKQHHEHHDNRGKTEDNQR